MQVRNATPAQLQAALDMLNREHYAGNLAFKSGPAHVGKTARSAVTFTLTVNDTKKRGGRRGFVRNKNGERRRIGGAACWHAHGHFFEALFALVPDAIVKSACNSLANPANGHNGNQWNEASPDGITGPDYQDGNWRDRQVGSMMDPAAFSDLCDCDETGDAWTGLYGRGERVGLTVQPTGSRDVWNVSRDGRDLGTVSPYAHEGEALEAARELYGEEVAA